MVGNNMISIITVVFNDIKNIEKSIQNSLAQTYRPIELIVVDGGSTDGTVDIIKKYDSSIKWISERDKGIYDAMNKGARMATGEWLLFHNCGDFFVSQDALKNVFDSYEDNGETFILANQIAFNFIGYKECKPSIIEQSYFFSMPAHHPATFIRREWQLQNLYDIKYKNSADYDFFIKSFIKGATYKYIDQPLVLFDCCEGTTANHYDITLRENIEILTNYGASEERILQCKNALRHFNRVKLACQWVPILRVIKKYVNRRAYLQSGWILSRPTDTLEKYNFLCEEGESDIQEAAQAQQEPGKEDDAQAAGTIGQDTERDTQDGTCL